MQVLWADAQWSFPTQPLLKGYAVFLVLANQSSECVELLGVFSNSWIS